MINFVMARRMLSWEEAIDVPCYASINSPKTEDTLRVTLSAMCAGIGSHYDSKIATGRIMENNLFFQLRDEEMSKSLP